MMACPPSGMISTLTLTGPPEDADATLQWASGTCQHQRKAFPLTIHPPIADATGNFSETLLGEVGFNRHATLTERARRVHARLRADLDHRHYSGIEVLRGLARRNPGADARIPFTFSGSATW